MLPTIVTVNPMRRRHRRHRNPESRRARSAAARSGWRHRRRNPESTRARRKAARAGWRHRRHSNPLFARRRRHVSHRRHRRHHNPIQRTGNEVVSMLVPAGIGAVSAVALDVIVAYLPLPTAVATGWGNIAVKAVGAVGLGVIAGMVAGKRNGILVGAGALTVVGYDAVKAALAPTLGTTVKGLSGLADFGDYSSMGAYMESGQPASGMGAYMNPAAYVSLPSASAASTGHPAPNAAALASLRSKQMAGFGRVGNTANF